MTSNFFESGIISVSVQFQIQSGLYKGLHTKHTLQISIGWLSVISSVIPLALKGILPIPIIPLSAKGITNEITDNHPIDICSGC